jgi:hypothetical protein
VTPQRIRGFPEEATEVAPIERDFVEVQQRLAGGEPLGETGDLAIVARNGHARADAAFHFHQLDVEIDRGGERRLLDPQAAQLHYFARFRPRGWRR